MERLKEYVFDRIAAMQREKEEARIEPSHIPFSTLSNALMKDIRSCLNELYKDKRIGVSKLLNDQAVYIKKDNNGQD